MKPDPATQPTAANGPASSWILPASFSILLAACLVCVSCTSTKPKPEPSRMRIQAEQCYDAGRAAYRQQNWTSASSSFGKAADAFEAMDDYAAEATARHNQGQALRRAGLYDEAIAAFQQSFAVNQRLQHPAEQALNLAGLAQCYRAQKKLDPAIEAQEKALKLAGPSRAIAATVQNDLALSLLQRGKKEDRDRVIRLLNAALEYNGLAGPRRSVAANQLNLGRAYLTFGENDPAEKMLTRALESFRYLDDPSGLAQTHELLGRLYTARGDVNKARFHFDQAREKYLLLKDDAGLKRIEPQK